MHNFSFTYLIAIVGLGTATNLRFWCKQDCIWFWTAAIFVSRIVNFCCQTLATAFFEFTRNNLHATALFWLFCDPAKVKSIFAAFLAFEGIVICHQMISIMMIATSKAARDTWNGHTHATLKAGFVYSLASTTRELSFIVNFHISATDLLSDKIWRTSTACISSISTILNPSTTNIFVAISAFHIQVIWVVIPTPAVDIQSCFRMESSKLRN